MTDVLLWLIFLLPFIMLLEAKRSVRNFILSGKLFFAESHELRLKTRTILFLGFWLASLPLSLISLVIILLRWR